MYFFIVFSDYGIKRQRFTLIGTRIATTSAAEFLWPFGYPSHCFTCIGDQGASLARDRLPSGVEMSPMQGPATLSNGAVLLRDGLTLSNGSGGI